MTGRYAEAEREYEAAIALDPENADYYNLLAINYSEWGKPEKAAESYKRAIIIKPHHMLYLSLAGSYQKLGRIEEAVDALKKSLEMKPTFTYGLYELGGIYYRQGRYQESLECFAKVVEIEPRHVFANHALGMASVMTGDKVGVMRQYDLLKSLNADMAADLLQAIRK